MINSEKEIYQNYFQEIAWKFDEEIFLWGEELIGKKLVVYAGKIKELPNYAGYAKRLVNCGVIFADVRKGRALKCISSRFDPEENVVYMQEATFNAIWIHLRNSVKLGIRRAEQTEAECAVRHPEDILDLHYLMRKGSEAKLEKNRIVYRPRPQTEQEKRLHGKRQSMLDHQKNVYFHSKEGGLVHDRSCTMLNDIADSDFLASEVCPENKQYCPVCLRTLMIRKGCAPVSKEIPICTRFFNQYGVKTSQLLKMVEEEHIKFYARSLDEMTIKSGEDMWKILVTPEKKLQLWHNNYVRVSANERYITDGFHDQGLGHESLKNMLNYISRYTWEKHLEGEARKNERIQESSALEQELPGQNSIELKNLTEKIHLEQTEKNSADRKQDEQPGLLHRIIVRIRSWWEVWKRRKQ